MSYNTYDRFQGCWWGATIAQILAKSNKSPTSDLYSQPWLIERQKLAVMLLEQKSAGSLQKFVADLPQPTNALQHNSSLLSLLPLIIFTPTQPTVGLREMLESKLHSADELAKIGVSRDILRWQYLLTTVLNARFALITQKQIIEEVDKYHPVSVLSAKLRLVLEAIAKGSSLNLIVKQLSTMKESESSAIALAWYCFATTPLDFQLSVRRAALVPSKLAWLTTTLTGTLSGAYNGMAEISAYSCRDEQNQEHLEHRLCQNLFADWLGILNYQSSDRAYNPNLDAIAPTRVIQPRQNLKIISQISTLK